MKVHRHVYRFSAIMFLVALLTCSLIWLISFPAQAPTLDSPKLPDQTVSANDHTFPAQLSSPINDSLVLATSYLVYDGVTGNVLAAREPETPVAIASLTKLMTGYLAATKGNFEDAWTVQAKDVLNISPVLGLKAGEKVKVIDLFNAMLVGSANDAALSLGSYLAENQHKPIDALMNESAEKLRMQDTHFSNPLGFDSDTNYSTAKDMEIIVQAIRTIPEFQKNDRSTNYSFTSITGITHSVAATNKLLLADQQIHAVKTGFTDEAQGAMITAIDLPSHPFYIIVLHSPNREQDTLELKRQIIHTYFQ